ncbi:MAG TPA: hypothetical protein VKP69_25745 [Isosphaeraceae bacterium]|nr:hypothetical protein [Isosphaeraceae bacterium]
MGTDLEATRSGPEADRYPELVHRSPLRPTRSDDELDRASRPHSSPFP